MPRRRKRNENLFSLALNSHWGVAALLAIGLLFVFQILIPSQFSSPVIKPLGEALKGVGWLAGGLFVLIAAINFIRQGSRRNDSMGSISNPRTSTDERPTTEVSNSFTPPGAQAPDPLIHGASAIHQSTEKPTAWSLNVLQSIEWKRFEELVAAYFRAKGMRAETQTHGADGGIDIRLYSPTGSNVLGLVQCKAWKNKLVGVAPVRELLGVMAHEKLERGFFIATGDFSKDALAFAESHRITLISGSKFVEMISLQAPEIQTSLLEVATEGDYQTPTCASCGIKLVNRGKFWGCSNYPRCKTTIRMAA